MIESYLDHHPQIDPAAYVHPASTVIGRVRIGAESSVWPSAVLRGDDNEIIVGSQTSIQDGTVVHLTTDLSNTVVGDRVTVGHNVTLHGCRIASDSIIGMGAILLDNSKIGRHVIIGAGTLVPMNKEIPDGVLALGNPFKVVRELTEQEIEWIELSWQSYVKKAQEYAERDRRQTPGASPGGA